VKIKAALAEIPEYKLLAAETLDKLSPDYVRGNVSQLILKPGFEDLVDDALEITTMVLNSCKGSYPRKRRVD